VIAPTRELVAHIEAALAPLASATGLTYVTVFGGVGANPQAKSLRRAVDVVLSMSCWRAPAGSRTCSARATAAWAAST